MKKLFIPAFACCIWPPFSGGLYRTVLAAWRWQMPGKLLLKRGCSNGWCLTITAGPMPFYRIILMWQVDSSTGIFFAPQSPTFHQYMSVCNSIISYPEQGKIACKGQALFSHGETVLNFLTLASQYSFSRIICHSQIVEYPSYITRQLFDGWCNTVFTNGFNQPSSKST